MHCPLGVFMQNDKRLAKALMFQGTASNAGKSVLTAAFGRILYRKGYKVAPFKAQNMSNNAAVTACGGEIGRAQAFQATACGLDADVRMNPLLLKPESDMGSQIVLRGQAMGHMAAMDYMKFRPEAQSVIHECYDSLASEFDLILLEGAGSPAEVNLRKYDLVNMHMAHYADASVMLIGDIDRGGVFASFLGTYECLDTLDRSRIKGYLVNRFRGDPSLLGDAYEFMLQRTGVPVLGTIPYIHDLGIPDEDAVTLRNRSSSQSGPKDKIDIALVDIPHISNQSDFDVLEQEYDVHLRIVRHAHEIGSADVVILPGSKSVLADLESLKKRQFDLALAQFQGQVVGICGGLQMLGNSIKDSGVEALGQAQGLGYLDLHTTFEPSKIVKRSEARHVYSQQILSGYEIHCGRTEGSAEVFLLSLSGEALGYSSPDRNVWGSYLHGIFDNADFRHDWLNQLRKSKGLGPRLQQEIYSLDQALDRIADLVENSVDLPKILESIGL